MPRNGMPLKVLVVSSSTNRPSRIHFRSVVPVNSVGGADGSIHILPVKVHEPTSGSSLLCSGPGVPCRIIASIITFGSGFAGGSAASRAVAVRPSATTSAVRDIRYLLFGGHGRERELSDGGD